MNYLTDNTRIVEKFDLITPNEVLEKYPLTDEVAALVYGTRNEISQVLHGLSLIHISEPTRPY